MKKLLSLLGIIGLMTFVAMPIYAQEEDVFDEERVTFEEDFPSEESSFNNEVSSEELSFNNEVSSEELSYNNEVYPEEVSYDDWTYWLNVEGYPQVLTEEDIANQVSDALNNLSDEELAWLITILSGFGLFTIIRGYCAYVFATLQPISKWEIYRKAGKKGWAFLIPFWGSMVYSEIGGINKWVWLLPWITWIFGFCAWIMSGKVYGIIMFILVLASLIWWIVATYRIARKYGWGVFASILHVLFTPITSLILWLGNYKYEGKSE